MERLKKLRLARRVRRYVKYKFIWPLELRWLSLQSDETFMRRIYYEIFGREINLDSPQTLNEKINYLKLYYRPKLLNTLVDKYAVRGYVQDKGYGRILNELYGVYDRVEDIPFDGLPDSFVAKVNHGSGYNVICHDKAAIDWKVEARKLKKWLKVDFSHLYREWAYKDVPRKIVVEKYLSSPDGFTPNDYKVYVFNGKVGLVQVDIGRYDKHYRTFYQLDWKPYPCSINHLEWDYPIPRPSNLDAMAETAGALAEGLPFARVDFFSVSGQIIFTEITIYAGAGLISFKPKEYDRIFGDMLDVSAIHREERGHA